MSTEDYDTSELPKRHKKFKPGDNSHESWGKAYDKIKRLIDTGAIFAIIGTRGTGKTQIGACLIGHVAINLERTVAYRKAFDVFLRIREAMKLSGDSERKAVSEFVKPYFLVIDAYEVRSESPFENRTLDHIIDRRYDSVHPTLIISNDTPESFTKSVGVSICDRISETGGIIEMNWESFR